MRYFRPFALLVVVVGAGWLLLGRDPAVAAGSLRNVSTLGTDSGDCTASPCRSIGYAVAQASAGDKVAVGGGTYKESVSIKKRLDLVGVDAVIDATGKTNGILVEGSAAAGSSVSGFTVMNADQEGILLRETSALTVMDNIVKNNDLGAKSPNPTGECAPQGEVPGDCGEGLHLWSVSQSTISGNTVSDNTGGILLTDESGPTFSNNVVNNKVTSTGEDCGIVLASHQFNPMRPVTPAEGGIFGNLISGNSVTNTGPFGAGVGLFAAAPGGATYSNRVIGNTLTGTGMPGVAIHSHAPNQNVNSNVISNNVISNNGVDPDANTGATAAIVVFADVENGAAPVQEVAINYNTISNNTYGIFLKGAEGIIDTANNTFASTVTTHIFTAPTAAPEAPAGGQTGIKPPSTGDAGLKRAGTPADQGWPAAVLALVLTMSLGAGWTLRVENR